MQAPAVQPDLTPAENETAPQAPAAPAAPATPAPRAAAPKKLSALEKIKLCLGAAKNNDMDTARSYRLTESELDEVRCLDGQDGKALVLNRKELWQRYVFLFSEKRALNIPPDAGEKPIKKNGVIQFPAAYFCLNGVPYLVPKGRSVEVPQAIYDAYNNDYDISMFQVQAIELADGALSDPLSFTQAPQMLWEKANR